LRFIELPHHRREIVHRRRPDGHFLELDAERASGAARVREIVGDTLGRRPPLAEPDRKATERLSLRVFTRIRYDRARIEAARQERADRNVRDHLPLDGAGNDVARRGDRVSVAPSFGLDVER